MTMLDGKTAASEGFDVGNCASAYDFEDLHEALKHNGMADRSNDDTYRAAFVLGFFSSYTLQEIPGSDRETYDEAYWSEAGQYVIRAGYCDSRQEEYEQEIE